MNKAVVQICALCSLFLLCTYIMMFPVIQTLQCKIVRRNGKRFWKMLVTIAHKYNLNFYCYTRHYKHDYYYNLLKIKIMRFQFNSSVRAVWIVIKNKMHCTLWYLKQTQRHRELTSLLDIYHCTCTKDLTQLNPTVFCDATPHTSVDSYQPFWENYCFHIQWPIFYHEHGVSSFLQHVCTHL
jgi:hypothetical protein